MCWEEWHEKVFSYQMVGKLIVWNPDLINELLQSTISWAGSNLFSWVSVKQKIVSLPMWVHTQTSHLKIDKSTTLSSLWSCYRFPIYAYHQGALSKPKSLGRPFRLRARARLAGCIAGSCAKSETLEPYFWVEQLTDQDLGISRLFIVFFSMGVLITTVSSGLWWSVMLMGEIGIILHKRIYATNHSVISQMWIVTHFGVCCMFHKICMRHQT